MENHHLKFRYQDSEVLTKASNITTEILFIQKRKVCKQACIAAAGCPPRQMPQPDAIDMLRHRLTVRSVDADGLA